MLLNINIAGQRVGIFWPVFHNAAGSETDGPEFYQGTEEGIIFAVVQI